MQLNRYLRRIAALALAASAMTFGIEAPAKAQAKPGTSSKARIRSGSSGSATQKPSSAARPASSAKPAQATAAASAAKHAPENKKPEEPAAPLPREGVRLTATENATTQARHQKRDWLKQWNISKPPQEAYTSPAEEAFLKQLDTLALNPPPIPQADLTKYCGARPGNARANCEKACGDAYRNGLQLTITGVQAVARLSVIKNSAITCGGYLRDEKDSGTSASYMCCRTGYGDAKKTFEEAFRDFSVNEAQADPRERRIPSRCGDDLAAGRRLGRQYCEHVDEEGWQCKWISESKQMPPAIPVCYSMGFSDGMDFCWAKVKAEQNGESFSHFMRSYYRARRAACYLTGDQFKHWGGPEDEGKARWSRDLDNASGGVGR